MFPQLLKEREFDLALVFSMLGYLPLGSEQLEPGDEDIFAWTYIMALDRESSNNHPPHA